MPFLGDCYIHDMPFWGIVIFMICHFWGIVISMICHCITILWRNFPTGSWNFSVDFQDVPLYHQYIFWMLSQCCQICYQICYYTCFHVLPCSFDTVYFLRFSTSQTVAVVTVATWQPFCWPWSYYLCWQPTCVCSALRCVRSSKSPAPWSRGGELIPCDERWVLTKKHAGIFTNTTWWFYQHKFGVIVHVTDFC